MGVAFSLKQTKQQQKEINKEEVIGNVKIIISSASTPLSAENDEAEDEVSQIELPDTEPKVKKGDPIEKRGERNARTLWGIIANRTFEIGSMASGMDIITDDSKNVNLCSSEVTLPGSPDEPKDKSKIDEGDGLSKTVIGRSGNTSEI